MHAGMLLRIYRQVADFDPARRTSTQPCDNVNPRLPGSKYPLGSPANIISVLGFVIKHDGFSPGTE